MTAVSFEVNRPQGESGVKTDLKERKGKKGQQANKSCYPPTECQHTDKKNSVLGIIDEVSSEIFQNFMVHLLGKECVWLGFTPLNIKFLNCAFLKKQWIGH